MTIDRPHARHRSTNTRLASDDGLGRLAAPDDAYDTAAKRDDAHRLLGAAHTTLTYPLIRPCYTSPGPPCLSVRWIPGRQLGRCAGPPYDDDGAVREGIELAVVSVDAWCGEGYDGAVAGFDLPVSKPRR